MKDTFEESWKRYADQLERQGVEPKLQISLKRMYAAAVLDVLHLAADAEEPVTQEEVQGWADAAAEEFQRQDEEYINRTFAEVAARRKAGLHEH